LRKRRGESENLVPGTGGLAAALAERISVRMTSCSSSQFSFSSGALEHPDPKYLFFKRYSAKLALLFGISERH
jgi:hypothetical protein